MSEATVVGFTGTQYGMTEAQKAEFIRLITDLTWYTVTYASRVGRPRYVIWQGGELEVRS